MQLRTLTTAVAVVKCMMPIYEAACSSLKKNKASLRSIIRDAQGYTTRSTVPALNNPASSTVVEKQESPAIMQKLNERLSKYNFEPFDVENTDVAQQIYNSLGAKVGCLEFILDYSGFYSTSEYEDSPELQPTFSWPDALRRDSQLDISYVNKIFENDGRAFTCFTDILELAIKNVSSDDVRMAGYFSNIFVLSSSNGNIKTFTFNTINFNNLLDSELPENMDMQQTCIASLRENSDVKCFTKSNYDYSFYKLTLSNKIIVTADQYIKRNPGNELPLTFQLKDGNAPGQPTLNYQIKAVIFKETDGKGGFYLCMEKACDLDVLGEEEKTVWLKKMLVNPMSVLYERV
ncbi:hypothetical protein ENBRE01_1107 [Enteropsectra breve]|nr:hypothetical protein ENBRE01_1107 [Enteropsectra breve]